MLNKHPRILEDLAVLLPPGGRRPDTRLAGDLGFTRDDKQALRGAVEAAWDIAIAERAADAWRTLADVAATIAAQLEFAPA